MPLGKVIGLGPGHCVTWGPSGDPAPTADPRALPLSAHAYCGQTVAHLSNCWALVIYYCTFYSIVLWYMYRPIYTSYV